MSDLMLLIIFLIILTSGFIFWKLSNIKFQGRRILPLRIRITTSLIILLLVPALILFGVAIALFVAIILLLAAIAYIINYFKLKH